MPTEKQIRDAIAATIATAAPLAVVIPRNILGIKNDGWLGMLQSAADNNRIRGWMVTLQSAPLIEDRINGAEYDLRFSVWQFLQYWTGDNTDNSEDAFSAEREAVIIAFAGQLAAPLSWAKPLEFSLIDLFSIGGRLVHIAQGSIAVSNVTGCV
jgi:hypothetical protein